MNRTLLPQWIAVAGLWCALPASASAEAHDPSAIVGTPGRGAFVPLPDGRARLRAADDPAHAPPHILYLNRCAGGHVVLPGWYDDSTGDRSTVLGDVAYFPEFPFADDSWSEVVAGVAGILAPFHIVVTDEDPGLVPHDEAVVCGIPEDAGLEEEFWGLAPYACGRIHGAVTFTFAEAIGDHPESIAETVTQEAAHAWGLDHSLECADPMSYLPACGARRFVDGPRPCGEYEARECTCGGTLQNTYRHIARVLGERVTGADPPQVWIERPTGAQPIPPDEPVELEIGGTSLDAVRAVTVHVDGALELADAAPPFGPWTLRRLAPGEHTLEVRLVPNPGAGEDLVSLTVRADAPDVDGGDADGQTDGDAGADEVPAPALARPGPGHEGCRVVGRNAAVAYPALWLGCLLGLGRRRRRGLSVTTRSVTTRSVTTRSVTGSSARARACRGHR